MALSIARKLIDAMGGTLTFESTEGQGTSGVPDASLWHP